MLFMVKQYFQVWHNYQMIQLSNSSLVQYNFIFFCGFYFSIKILKVFLLFLFLGQPPPASLRLRDFFWVALLGGSLGYLLAHLVKVQFIKFA